MVTDTHKANRKRNKKRRNIKSGNGRERERLNERRQIDVGGETEPANAKSKRAFRLNKQQW